MAEVIETIKQFFSNPKNYQFTIIVFSILNLIFLYINFYNVKVDFVSEVKCDKDNTKMEEDRLRYKYKNSDFIKYEFILYASISIVLLSSFVILVINNLFKLTLDNIANPLLIFIFAVIILVLLFSFGKIKLDYIKLNKELTDVINSTCNNKKFATTFSTLDNSIKKSIIKKYTKKLELENPNTIYTTNDVETALSNKIDTGVIMDVDKLIEVLNIPYDLKLINDSYHAWIVNTCYDNSGKPNNELTPRIKNYRNYINFRYENNIEKDINLLKSIINLSWIILVVALIPLFIGTDIFNNYRLISILLGIAIIIIIFLYIILGRVV